MSLFSILAIMSKTPFSADYIHKLLKTIPESEREKFLVMLATQPIIEQQPASGSSGAPASDPPPPSFNAGEDDHSEVVRDPRARPAEAGEEPSKCSESSSSSSSSSTDSEVESEPGPYFAPLDEPVWRPECQVWQHRQSRTVHLLPLADVDKGSFVCGRAKSSAYFKVSGHPIVDSLKCAQCDRGKTIRGTAQLVHVLEKEKTDVLTAVATRLVCLGS